MAGGDRFHPQGPQILQPRHQRSGVVGRLDRVAVAGAVGGNALAGREADFAIGLACLAKLSAGKTFVCAAPEFRLPLPAIAGVQIETFDGPLGHPVIEDEVGQQGATDPVPAGAVK